MSELDLKVNGVSIWKPFVDNVEKIIAETSSIAGKMAGERFEFGIRDCLTDNEPRPQSPIEQILYIAINFVRYAYGCTEYIGDVPYINGRYEGAMAVEPQFKIVNYRADFMISSIIKGEITSFIVECDGHDFHDRNEKERRYEKQRDRFFQKKGYKVFHYTGSEIVRNPYKVAIEIVAHAQGIRPNSIIDSLIGFLPSKKQREEIEVMREDLPKGFF